MDLLFSQSAYGAVSNIIDLSSLRAMSFEIGWLIVVAKGLIIYAFSCFLPFKMKGRKQEIQSILLILSKY